MPLRNIKLAQQDALAFLTLLDGFLPQRDLARPNGQPQREDQVAVLAFTPCGQRIGLAVLNFGAEVVQHFHEQVGVQQRWSVTEASGFNRDLLAADKLFFRDKVTAFGIGSHGVPVGD